MTACLGRVLCVRTALVLLVFSACLATIGGQCFAAPFELLLRNDSEATLIPYRVAVTAEGNRVRVADPDSAIAPGAEVEIATTGFDPIFFDPVSRRAVLLDIRSDAAPSVMAAVFQYETSPATAGARSPVRTELSRTALAMSSLRPNLLTLTADWSVRNGARSAPVIVQQVRPVVYTSPAPIVVAPPPVVRVVRMPPPPPVRVYVHGPHHHHHAPPHVWVRW